MKITGSVVLYKHTIEKIAPLLKSLVGSDVEMLYIIDQGPNEWDYDIARELETWTKREGVDLNYMYTKRANEGYGMGHNVALRSSQKKGVRYHVVLNPDVCFEPEAIRKIASYMDSNEDVGQVMPKVLYPNGELQRLCKLLPKPMDLLGRLMLPRFFTDAKTRRFELAETGYRKAMNVPYLSGCFMMFRMSAMVEVGLFDERYFMYAEDIDMTRRMHTKYKTMFWPEVQITHLHNQADRRSVRLLWVHVVNIIKYFNKWGWIWDKQRDNMNERILQECKMMES